MCHGVSIIVGVWSPVKCGANLVYTMVIAILSSCNSISCKTDEQYLYLNCYYPNHTTIRNFSKLWQRHTCILFHLSETSNHFYWSVLITVVYPSWCRYGQELLQELLPGRIASGIVFGSLYYSTCLCALMVKCLYMLVIMLIFMCLLWTTPNNVSLRVFFQNYIAQRMEKKSGVKQQSWQLSIGLCDIVCKHWVTAKKFFVHDVCFLASVDCKFILELLDVKHCAPVWKVLQCLKLE